MNAALVATAAALFAGSSAAAAPAIPAYSASYAGTIGGSRVDIALDRFADRIRGSYSYSRHAKHPIALTGTISGDKFEAEEKVGGKVTGLWRGIVTPGSIAGQWSSPDKTRTLPLHAESAAGKPFPYDIRVVLTPKADLAKIVKAQGAPNGCAPTGDLQVTAIELTDPATGKIVQKLGADEPEVLSRGTCRLFAPVVEDMNFDGWPDLRIASFLPAAPNVPYADWLFDPKTRKFVASGALMQIESPKFDSRAKRITSFVRNSCCSYTGMTYAWENGQPRLIAKTDRDYDPDQPPGRSCYTERHYARVGGAIKLVKTDKGCEKR